MKAILVSAGVLAVVALGAVFGPDLIGGGSDETAAAGIEVKRGPLRISVSESGNLEAANSVEIASELEGSSTILYLLEEGSRVEPGELLVELDATDLLDRKVTQEITVENAKGALVKAEQNLAIQKSQNESDIAIAKRTLDFAQRDKEKYLEGDWPQQRQAAEDEILLAREELVRAEDKLKWSKDLKEKGFLTRTELEADELALQRTDIQLKQVERALELLKEYDFPRQLRSLEADVEESQRELDRVELQAAARLVDFEANVRSAQSTYDLEQAVLNKLEDQLSKSRIYAPAAGLVVYAREEGRRGNDDPIAEGTTVRERQGIITIPSSEKMVVEVKLHESVVQQVEVGQRALVRVDALPGREFEGVVTFKAILPESNSWWANPNLRVYRAEVEVGDPDPSMRPGMSCEVEVVVAELEDAVYVPVQAIVVSGGETICFVSEGG
ncbi:MAG: efflux RND transporter periplasmic adaptor subunit, partial [Planctomycetota bacterium]